MKTSLLIRNMLATMIAAMFFVLLVSWAQAAELTVENNTGQTIVGLNLSRPGADNWSDSLLAPDTNIAAGESVSMNIDDAFELGDLRAILDNGGQELYSGINFKGLSRVKLNRRGTLVAE